MRLALIAAQDPSTSLGYFSGIPYHLYLALSKQVSTIPLAVAGQGPTPGHRLYRKLIRKLTGQDLLWGIRRPVLRKLAEDTLTEALGVGADSVLTVGQGNLVYWSGALPAASFSDILYGTMAVFRQRIGRTYDLDTRQRIILKDLGQRAVDNAVRVFITSRFAVEGAQRNLGTRIPEEKLVITHIGANLEGIPESIPSRKAPPPLRLLWVGSAWTNKGGDDALAVLSALRAMDIEATLDMVGHAPESHRPTETTYHGFLRKDNPLQRRRLMDLYGKAHVLLLPTRADFTPSGVAEAAAMGVLVVTTPVGGIPELLRDDEMIMLPISAYRNQAPEAIKSLMASGELARMAKRARQSYETRLNWDIIAERIVQELTMALASRS